jgi:hypothetical protein
MDGDRADTAKFMIRDRGGQFATDFDAVLADAGIRVLKNPPAAPKANAICERMIGTPHRELLDRTLVLNEHHLRQVPHEYLAHYNTARPHRTLEQVSPLQAEISTGRTLFPGWSKRGAKREPAPPPLPHPQSESGWREHCNLMARRMPAPRLHGSSPAWSR